MGADSLAEHLARAAFRRRICLCHREVQMVMRLRKQKSGVVISLGRTACGLGRGLWEHEMQDELVASVFSRSPKLKHKVVNS